jgi:glycosyltransferase involved in cell wall biosynthesis
MATAEKAAGEAGRRADDPVRLLVLCAGDPEGERTFSGSARGLFQALERRGIVHAKVNVTKGFTDVFSPPPLYVRALRKFDVFRWEGRYRWSRWACEGNSRRARALARAHPGFNACLMYGTNYNPQLDVPTYCCFDATSAQVCRGAGWEMGNLSARQVEAVISYQQDVFDQCTTICPRTEFAAQSVVDDYGIDRSRICVTGAGPNYSVDPLPHGPYDGQTILFIGREFDRKGGPLILDAFRLVRKSMPKAKLVIIGCSPEIDEAGVDVVGPIKKDVGGGMERMLAHYSQASVFCIMSSFEPFGIVVLEAQSCGVPCVVPKRFAFPEMVVDGVTGRLLAQDDAGLLAETFLDLLGDPAGLAKMGLAGEEHVQANFTWDVAARRIHDRIRADLGARLT